MATHPDDHNQPHHDVRRRHQAIPPAGRAARGSRHDAGNAKPQADSPKKTKMARQVSKPTMIAHDEEEAAVPAIPNLSLDHHDEEIPVLGEVDEADIPVLEAEPEPVPELKAASDVAHAQPVSDMVEMEMVSDVAEAQPVSDVATAEPVSEFTVAAPVSDIAVAAPTSDIAVAAPDFRFRDGRPTFPTSQWPRRLRISQWPRPTSDIAVAAAHFRYRGGYARFPISQWLRRFPIYAMAAPISDVNVGQPISAADVTGADVPRADVTGAEHVLDEGIVEAESASAVQSGAQTGSNLAELAEEVSDIQAAEAVLEDEPLDRGSRPSARAESPIRVDTGDDDVLDFASEVEEAPSSRGKRKMPDIEATEEVLAGEPGGVDFDSGTVNWNDVGSGARQEGRRCGRDDWVRGRRRFVGGGPGQGACPRAKVRRHRRESIRSRRRWSRASTWTIMRRSQR